MARSGYVNLLRGGRHPSPPAGDDRRMLEARREVMASGYYLPLAGALAGMLQSKLGPSGRGPRILDVGCGEGWLTAAVGGRLVGGSLFGVDVSRLAVDMAARRYGEVSFAVGSAFDLPVMPGSMDAVISVFAARNQGQLHQVLAPGGVLAVVTPGRDHLVELRRRLYSEVRDPGRQAAESWSGFEAIELVDLQYSFGLETDTLTEALVAMTPYAWRANRIGRGAIRDLDSVTVAMRVQIFRPAAGRAAEPQRG